MASGFSAIVPLVVGVLAVMAISAAESAHHAAAPAPAVDCGSVVMSLADCLDYVSNGSTVTKPKASCCSGLKTVLKTNAECLCEGLKSSSQFGVNMTKALSLPSACHVSAPSVSNCGLSTGSISPVSQDAPIGSPGVGQVLAPAPALRSSALSALVPVGSFAAALTVAFFVLV